MKTGGGWTWSLEPTTGAITSGRPGGRICVKYPETVIQGRGDSGLITLGWPTVRIAVLMQPSETPAVTVLPGSSPVNWDRALRCRRSIEDEAAAAIASAARVSGLT